MSGDAVAFLGRGLYGVSRMTSGEDTVVATTNYSNNLLIPRDTLAWYSQITEFRTVGINTGTAAIKVTHTFQARIPQAVTLACRLRTRLRWDINATGLAAGAIGRWNVDVKKNAAAITGLTKGYGVKRALTSTGTFTETHIVTDIPQTSWGAADTLDIACEFEVTTAEAGTSLEIGLLCDPATAGNELVFEFDLGHPST